MSEPVNPVKVGGTAELIKPSPLTGVFLLGAEVFLIVQFPPTLEDSTYKNKKTGAFDHEKSLESSGFRIGTDNGA